MKGGIGLIATHESYNVSVSRNWYKTVSNLYEKSYIQFGIEIVGLNK